MSSRQLSADIVSLIHHVELNESGWWKKGVGQIVKGVLWKAQTPLTIEALKQAIRREAGGVALNDEELTKQLLDLSEHGIVSVLPNSTYKLTERAFQDLSKANKEAELEQEACHKEFSAACEQYCPEMDAEKAWKDFTQALSTAIRVSGANLFRLLVGGDLSKDFDWLTNFISKTKHEHHDGLRKVLVSFFDPHNQVCRNQILRFMTAYFFAEATQLRPETLDAINKARKTRSIKVVLDTNFIFSVLQLHDNPADDAALSLLNLAQKSGSKLDIKLYVLPSTLEEAKRVLLAQIHLVERIRTTRAMANAAASQPLPGIAKKFFTTAAKVPGLSAQTFFQPYIDDLKLILDGKGISVLDAHPSIYHMRQDVIDDVMHEVKREEAELPEKRRKGYETLLHDAVLWHAVNDRRPANTDTPFEVEYWAVSIDWRLIGFDRAKRAAKASSLPVVLHPSNLVQLIQFWVPRSHEVEESLIDSLRLPLFFQSFDPEDEKATLRVLESLSRFENIGDLPESTIRVVLANKALRARLRGFEASNEEAFELVRDELLSHHKQVLDKLEEAEGNINQREMMLNDEREARASIESRHEELSQRVQEIESKRLLTEQQARQVAERNSELTDAIIEQENLTLAERKRANQAEYALDRLKFVLFFLILPVTLGIIALALANHWKISTLTGFTNEWGVLSIKITILLLPVTVAFFLLPSHAESRPALQTWHLSRWCSFIGKRFIAAPLIVGTQGIFAGALWDGVKLLFGLHK